MIRYYGIKKVWKWRSKKHVNTRAQVHDLDPAELEEAVRLEARKLYETYDTYEFTQMIGINPFEGLWGTFEDEGDFLHKDERNCSRLS